MTDDFTLASLGWRPFFQQQLSLEEWELAVPARILEQHRTELELATEYGMQILAVTPSIPVLTVGDWVLLDQRGGFLRLLERQSCFRRKAAGSKVAEQLLGANIDSAFIVCSLNDDFNLNRIERYLSVVNNAGVEPVVVLTKIDLCPDPAGLLQAVQGLDRRLCVVAVNALSVESVAALEPWCQPGRTIVLLGSSGAGKSTLGNTLMAESRQRTQSIREDDAKGRHTTTRRSLLPLPGGAMIMDTPGMRELQLADCDEGISATFADIEELAERCRFGDCHHDSEPGCAVRQAIEAGRLDERRFLNYRKLSREQAFNSASLSQRRAGDRALGRFYKRAQKASREMKSR
ncbi:MAG: ribosome small subunit-dependent GTPase A [Halieaceae bacterium]|nr:ribosome small subunit-dependent GTPase A [Halieaceae bacterium]